MLHRIIFIAKIRNIKCKSTTTIIKLAEILTAIKVIMIATIIDIRDRSSLYNRLIMYLHVTLQLIILLVPHSNFILNFQFLKRKFSVVLYLHTKRY